MRNNSSETVEKISVDLKLIWSCNESKLRVVEQKKLLTKILL